jgi:hypothetical protein
MERICYSLVLMSQASESFGVFKLRRKRIQYNILHCKTSQSGSPRQQSGGRLHCRKTRDRDVNASRNILMLTLLHKVFGRERPLAFLRDAPRSSSKTPPTPDTYLGTQTVERFTKAATLNIFENLFNLLHPPTLPKSNDMQSG